MATTALKVADESPALIDPNLHDGSLLGILILKERIELTVADVNAHMFRIILDDVNEFRAMDFRQGNTILDITIVRGQDAQVADLALLDLENPMDAGHLQRLHQRVVNESLSVLELNPSYGCQLIAIARNIWIESK